MLEDKFIKYISDIKSPYEENEITQEDISYDGYMRYYRDCMIESIGTKEASVQFKSYYGDFVKSCDEKQKEQFIKNCIDKIIIHYRMTYLSAMITENEYPEKDLLKLISFFVYSEWLKYFPKCLSFIDEKLINNDSKLKIFLTSDYDSFVGKLCSYKRCCNLIREYYMYCSKNDGIDTLLLTLKDDMLTNFIEQYKIKQQEVK